MSYLFLIPVSLALAITALLVFLWTLRSDQYEDLDGAAERILIDEDYPIVDKDISIETVSRQETDIGPADTRSIPDSVSGTVYSSVSR